MLLTVHVTLSPCCRETCQKFIPPEMWPSNLLDLNPVDYSIWGILQERVYRSQIHDVKELKERLLSEWRLLDHTIIVAVIAHWHSRLNAGVCVSGGHFEHTFWASDFLLYFACFIDTGFRKCDRYKHVQSANIVWNVLLFCLRLSHGIVTIQQTCGRKFSRQWLWHSVVKFCTKNYENLSIYVKVTAKKSVAPFLFGLYEHTTSI